MHIFIDLPQGLQLTNYVLEKPSAATLIHATVASREQNFEREKVEKEKDLNYYTRAHAHIHKQRKMLVHVVIFNCPPHPRKTTAGVSPTILPHKLRHKARVYKNYMTQCRKRTHTHTPP